MGVSEESDAEEEGGRESDEKVERRVVRTECSLCSSFSQNGREPDHRCTRITSKPCP